MDVNNGWIYAYYVYIVYTTFYHKDSTLSQLTTFLSSFANVVATHWLTIYPCMLFFFFLYVAILHTLESCIYIRSVLGSYISLSTKYDRA